MKFLKDFFKNNEINYLRCLAYICFLFLMLSFPFVEKTIAVRVGYVVLAFISAIAFMVSSPGIIHKKLK